MATIDNIGAINGHAVGIIMKELVRRAISAIRNERIVFETRLKTGAGGAMDDMLTSADLKAQQVYVRSLEECFPACGLIGEENNLRIAPKAPTTAHFTIDPLDGTKAFVRRQSHGVGTMIALVDRAEVLAAYVGDVNTREIYGFRPGSKRAYRITDFDAVEPLEAAARSKKPLRKRYVLLRDPPEEYSALSRAFIAHMDSLQIDGGSIGVWTARLWKDEVGAALLPPGWETPWDSSPVIGISRQVGMAFLRPATDNKTWEEFDPPVPLERFRRDHDVLIVPRARVKEVGGRPAKR
jgi:3'-phosphoadenosine 5'-phosphosulfate (PAPS) 3'-phosphatase